MSYLYLIKYLSIFKQINYNNAKFKPSVETYPSLILPRQLTKKRVGSARTNFVSATVKSRWWYRACVYTCLPSRPLIIILAITPLHFRIQLLSRSIVATRKIHAKMSAHQD